MAATIKLKRGTSTPSTSDIASGEVAIDTSAKKLYINDSGTVKEIGGGGGLSSDSDGNTVGGYLAGNSFDGNTSSNNTLFGWDAGKAITSGYQNTIFGANTGEDMTTGIQNTAFGSAALKDVTTGQANVAVGYMAGGTITTTHYGVFIGQNSGEYTSGAKNTLVGQNTGQANSGSNNLVLGYNAKESGTSTSNEITLGDTNITKFRIPGLGFELDTDSSSGFILDFGSVA
tara:strand:+ start:52 stop:741 length:690 start_codon:yes stop_codon:yes gene_type:complete